MSLNHLNTSTRFSIRKIFSCRFNWMGYMYIYIYICLTKLTAHTELELFITDRLDGQATIDAEWWFRWFLNTCWTKYIRISSSFWLLRIHSHEDYGRLAVYLFQVCDYFDPNLRLEYIWMSKRSADGLRVENKFTCHCVKMVLLRCEWVWAKMVINW